MDFVRCNVCIDFICVFRLTFSEAKCAKSKEARTERVKSTYSKAKGANSDGPFMKYCILYILASTFKDFEKTLRPKE